MKMLNNKVPTIKRTPDWPAQAMVEFAIALPVLMLMLVGIFEAGRMIFTYAAVSTAAREGSRYASAVGYNDAGTALKYNDCEGIIEVAQKTAFFAPLVGVKVSNDRGPGDTPEVYCERIKGDSTFNSKDVTLGSGDRVSIEVTASYAPLIKLIPFRSRDFTATSSRTILGVFELGVGTITPTPMGGGPTRTATVTRAITNTPAGTLTRTSTPTRTLTPGAVFTLTSQTTPTITLLPADTGTPTDTALPTVTGSLSPTASPTFTPSFTPTSTSTPVPGCGSLSTTALSISGNFMSMTITNPHDTITVASIHLVWNAVNGGPSGKPLIWEATIVAGQSWNAGNDSGNYTSTPGTTVTIPGNNQTSQIFIAFDKPYNNAPTNATSLTINFSTIGCSSITLTR